MPKFLRVLYGDAKVSTNGTMSQQIMNRLVNCVNAGKKCRE